MMLGDLGADVIKVERPGSGDETRGWGPPFTSDGESAYFLAVNRNKLSLAADLADPTDRAVVLDLIRGADVVLENFLPGSLERMGIDAIAEPVTHRGHVYVDIVDGTGLLVDAASGTPGDGASVEAYTVNVENLDPTTLRLSWVDFPIDNALALYIDRFEDGYRFVLVQPDPTGTTDAMGFDRELVLTFSQPISASQVETFLQGGLDTPG